MDTRLGARMTMEGSGVLTTCPPLSPHPHPHTRPVMPGGRLDARFVQIVRGGGRYINGDKRLNLNVGTHVMVRTGGDFTATGWVPKDGGSSRAVPEPSSPLLAHPPSCVVPGLLCCRGRR